MALEKDDIKKLKDEIIKGLRDNGLVNEGSSDAASKLKDTLRETLEIQKDISKSGQNYLDHMKNLKKLQKEIGRLQKDLAKSDDRIAKLKLKAKLATDEEKANIEALIEEEQILQGLIKKRLGYEQQSADATARALKDSSKLKGIYRQSVNDVKSIKSAWSSISSFVGGFQDVFKWEKSIKMTAMNMGVLGTRFDGFSKTMVKAATKTAQWGMDITEVTKIQGAYSDELGNAVMLSEEGAARLGAMAHVTGLGAEGAGKMAGELGKVGLSAERTANFVEQSMQDSMKMGLNAGKVMKNISANLKLLNKYNFKGGTKSLARMAQYATKMGVSMNLAGSMAEKLFDVDGAVEMSSQLQVLGGEWSKLADPFKLMYMARNDMEGLTKSLVGATKNMSKWNNETKEFDLSSQAMAQLREVAKITGADFEELASAAKKAANYAKIDKQIGIGFKDKATKEFIENTAKFDEKGQAIIRIDGKDKLVKTLNESDRQAIQRTLAEKLKMEDMAKQSQSLDELWKNTVIMLKQLLVPIVEAINKKLMPAMTGLMAKFSNPKFIDGIIEFGKKVGDIIGSIGKFLIEKPKWLLPILGGFGLFEAAKWILNGMKLGLGFNMVARAGGGMGPMGPAAPGSGAFGTTPGAGMAKNFSAAASSKMLKLGGVATGLFTAYNEYQENKANKMDTTENAVRSGSKGLGAGLGAWGGAAAGAAIGSVVPIVGTLIGGLIGGALGAWGGGALGEGAGNLAYGDKKVNDGVVFNPKDKFMKVNDSTMIAGTNENGNKSLAKAIMSSTVPGFAMVDYLMNSGKNSGSSAGSSKPGEVHHKFDNDVKIDGKIELVSNGETVAKIGKEILKDTEFVVSIQKMINKANIKFGQSLATQ